MARLFHAKSFLSVLVLATVSAAAVVQDSTEATAQQPAVAARGKDALVVRVDELDPILLNRYGGSKNGQDLLALLIQAQLLERLAAEAKIEITNADVGQRWQQLDKQARAAGVAGGLLAEIEKQGFTAEEFRELLRVSMIHELLTRRALGLGDDDVVTGAQQQVWLEQEMSVRGLERPAPPWPEGVVARCGEVEVTTDEFAEFLRKRLPREQVNETCWHTLLLKGMVRRMPDLSEEALQRGIDREIARRRANHAVEYPQISYEQRLAATGRSVGQLGNDPSVLIATLSRLWVDRDGGEEGLKRAYEAERGYFDGRHGKAVRTHMLFLVAGRFANELQKRTYEDAEEELAEILDRVGNADDFAALAGQLSEESKTREENGELGWITRADPRYPRQLCAAVFEVVDTGGKIPTEGRAVGPVRLDTGSALLWITAVREGPSWEIMREHVHEELRRRFIEDVMPRNAVQVEL